MATRAVNVVNNDLGSTGDSNTVVLVVDLDFLESDVVTGGDVEAVAVVSSRVITTGAVGLITGSVVQHNTGDGEVLAPSDVETVNGPVHDVQVSNLGIVGVFDNNEVVGPRNLTQHL